LKGAQPVHHKPDLASSIARRIAPRAGSAGPVVVELAYALALYPIVWEVRMNYRIGIALVLAATLSGCGGSSSSSSSGTEAPAAPATTAPGASTSPTRGPTVNATPEEIEKLNSIKKELEKRYKVQKKAHEEK
jgi:hypothetical protein